MANDNQITCPLMTVGGIAKRYLVPGWRVGWVVVHTHLLQKMLAVRSGVIALSQLILGSNTLVQSIVPTLLNESTEQFYEDTLLQLETNAKLCQSEIAKCSGLTAIVPQGAMYLMVLLTESSPLSRFGRSGLTR